MGDPLFLPIAEVMVDLGVTALAQAHEVSLGMCAAFTDRYDMMYFLHWCDPAFLEALFT